VRPFPSFYHFRNLVLVSFAALALNAIGCAAPSAEEDAEEEGSTESSIVQKGGGACPIDARLSQGFSGKHDGIDLANKKGTPIYAVMSGKVVASGPAQGYGQWIRIQHNDGSMTEYGHMSKRLVQVGATVKAGQKIALVGSEGESTGPHLHLRTYRSAGKVGSGNGMNPIDFLKSRGVSIPCKPSGAVVDDEPVVDPTAGNDGASDGTVTFWKAAEVFATPSEDATVIANVKAKATADADCWTEGDTVTEGQYSHDKWVKVTVNGQEGYVSGVFLKGDETGGITKQCAGGTNTD
jgi:biotin carboxyl carrier protein